MTVLVDFRGERLGGETLLSSFYGGGMFSLALSRRFLVFLSGANLLNDS